jgi:hypothetical protein
MALPPGSPRKPPCLYSSGVAPSSALASSVVRCATQRRQVQARGRGRRRGLRPARRRRVTSQATRGRAADHDRRPCGSDAGPDDGGHRGAVRGPREIAQDLLDRAGPIATQVHQIVPTTVDPILRFHSQIRREPSRATRPAAAIITRSSRRRSWKQRSSSQKVSQPTTRRRGSER